MKLFNKYNRINIPLTIVIFIVGSFLFYFLLQKILIRQLDETLKGEMQEILSYVQSHHQLPDIQNTREQWTTVDSASIPPGRVMKRDASWFDKRERELEPLRQIIFPLHIDGKGYTITVSKSEFETEYLLKLIIGLTIAMIALILVCNFIVNRYILKKLWQPFYQTIESFQRYKLSNANALTLPKGKIDEINTLNESLNEMSSRANREYSSLKSFTENASHEMQTPLAVIRTHTDLLLQGVDLTEEDLKHIHYIENSTQRLSKLHQSLLLITKIENRQFVLSEKVEMEEVIKNYVSELEELLCAKRITLELETVPVYITFHKNLAEIMIANLVSNAVRYTQAGGKIILKLQPDSLSILNSGTGGGLDDESIFKRFYKAHNTGDGTGLGLAIVKEICALVNFNIYYQFDQGMHKFVIQFQDKVSHA